jgi:hypothetical protein
MGIKTILVLISLAVLDASARPISYSGGHTLMMFSDNMKDSIYYHFSPTYKFSVGIEAIKDHYFDDNYSFLRGTYLVNRKNTQHSQRNLYIQSGISIEDISSNFYGIHGDWETRRWFAGFGLKKLNNKVIDYDQKHAQFGVAPYLGEYGDLHTWIMLKTKKNSLNGGWSTYPVFKFFKGNALIEFGYNNKTEWDAHYMYRF